MTDQQTEAQKKDLRQRFVALLKDEDYQYSRPRRGEVVEATILSIGDNDIIVDLGAKRDGIIAEKDLERVDEEYLEELNVGDQVPVVIMKESRRNGGLLVSLNKGLEHKDWLDAETYLESEDVFKAEVNGFNRGGVVVDFGRLRGFVPNSHLTSIPSGVPRSRLREAKADLVDKILSLVVIEVNQRRRRLVLSERMAQRQMREQVLDELEEGQVRTGIVRNLVDFGAFVDLGGIDGLVHISELDWKHVNHPSEVLQVGDEVEVYVLGVEKERERISLSRKKLLPDPWERVTQTLQEGEFVEGKVTDVVDFGAFVDIGEGVEGLVHTSEMPPGVKHTDLESGTPVTVRVLSVDEWRRRISLRLTAIHAKDEDLPEEIAAQRIPAEEETAEEVSEEEAEAVEAQELHTEEEIPEEITAQEQETTTEEDVSEEPVAQETAMEEDVSEEPVAQETDAQGIDAQELHTEEEIPEELAAQEATESPAQADEEQLAQQAT